MATDPATLIADFAARMNKKVLMEDDFLDMVRQFKNLLEKRFASDRADLDEAVRIIANRFNELQDTFLERATTAETTLTTNYNTKSKDFETRLNKAIEDMRAIVNRALDEQTNGMNFIYDKVASLKDGLPGKEGAAGKDADPVVITQLTEQLGTMTQRLDEIAKRPLSVAGAYTPLVRTLYNQSFPETPNGVRTTFSLIKAPKNANGVAIFQNRTRCHLTEDFTLSNKTVTFTSAPITGDKLTYDITF